MISIGKIKTSLHDSLLWAMRFDDCLYFDLDCLVSCVEKEGEIYNTIKPITLVFYDVENLKISLESEWVNGLEIDKVDYIENDNIKSIKFILQEGIISFQLKKYEAYIKGPETITKESYITEEKRGGYNFLKVDVDN